MTGIILDAVLMLLLVAALGYGVRLERKLTALREGQLAFAGAVKELNTAASRAESALANLRASGQETDLLHDRIVKARALKQELESLMARAPQRPAAAAPAPVTEPLIEDDRERRLATLAARLGEESRSPAVRPATAERVAPVLQAIAANQAAKQSLNRARRSLDEDLFAA
ncbi:MAG: hypothetical protein EON91_06725 [Brevundimonas sp.]|uniref:DUF6468 domain-containing protein n=1 Tax=Brevundimonas sp. TaxID=1871086 RepID=UPI0011F9448B|nr:DUF6468 domain-containing protein [Brevundimonas sp.]RZJ18115.1 MAG: hypothetical protein EON91_06725 [Brevundimonas sp.]